MVKVAAIVPAAGKGSRLKSHTDKPYIEICGKPILAHTLLKLSKNKHISEIIVAVNRKKVAKLKRDIINRFKIKKIKFTIGGRRRVDSVFNAFKKVSGDIDYILVHDCVRPFIDDSLVSSSLNKAKRFGASVVAVPVKPTLKYVTNNSLIKHTPDRRNLWEAQTPQVFRKDLMEKAYRNYRKTYNKKDDITDDSMLVEKIGFKPKIVLGSYRNIKITTQEDLKLAEILTKTKRAKRIYAHRNRIRHT